MRWIASFGKFWYDFIVGDDWRLAVGVVAAIGVVVLASHHDVEAWWFLPVVVALLLGISVARELRTHVR